MILKLPSRLIIVFILIVLLTSMSHWLLKIPNTQEGDILYGIIAMTGLYLFNLYMLVSSWPKYKEDQLSTNFIDFAIGYCAYGLIKIHLLNPFEVTTLEYMGCIGGVIFILLKYVYTRNRKGSN